MYVVGLPDADPDRPRLVEPELRSRVVGYLATAPEVGPDHRTDGVWVWPAALVDHLRSRGVGPRESQLYHIIARRFRPPAEMPPLALDEAARAIAGRSPAARRVDPALLRRSVARGRRADPGGAPDPGGRGSAGG